MRPAPRQPPDNPPRPVELEWKLTWVRYNGVMKLNNPAHTADFYGGVEVLHLPVAAPDRQPAFDATVNKLPAGAVHLSAAQMTVYSAKDAAGLTRQQMEAKGKAKVTYGDEFFGNGDVIKFDESKQLMTIESFGGGLAVVKRFKVPGNQPSTLKGRKIVYNRLADSFEVDGAYSITGN
jgi:hypothetical protein